MSEVEMKICDYCGGDGEVECTECEDGCDECSQSGYVECDECAGEGEIQS